MKLITAVLLIFFCGYAIPGLTQTEIDSTVISFLSANSNSLKPFLRIKTKNNKIVREANFFVEPGDSVFSQSLKIRTFIFGFSASHERRYFFLRVNLRNCIKEKVICAPTIEEAIQVLFVFLLDFKLTNEERSILVRALTYAYD